MREDRIVSGSARWESTVAVNFRIALFRISDLETEIAELESRLPAHSVKPSMVERLEELEERLERAKEARGKLGRPV